MTAGQSSKLVFNIQYSSMHDGPGIRTVFFFKGCPLHCPWCSNPESQRSTPELAFKPDLCLGIDICGRCEAACPNAAIQHDSLGRKIINRQKCKACGTCVAACPAKALTLFGQHYDVAELVKKGEQDRNFYETSGGGITLSGGEPLWNADVPAALLKAAKEKGLHTCVETCGCFDTENEAVLSALSNLDFIFYDIKHCNPQKLRAVTGANHMRIIDNLKYIRSTFPHIPIMVRTPVIGNFNADIETIEGIASLIAEIGGIQRYELLRYHSFGIVKYAQLGRPYLLGDEANVATELMEKLCATASKHIPCIVR